MLPWWRHMVVLAFATGAASAGAATLPPATQPEARGQAIAEQADAREEGFGSTVTRLDMVLANAPGRTRSRELTWKTLEDSAGDRSLVVFHEPRDIAGTALLSASRPSGDDRQWLYLPALKRVKRIAAVNRAGSFVGSEFSYEDLTPERVQDYEHRWLREEACGDWSCHVIERRPRHATSGYLRQVLWIDRDELRVVRVDYYDRANRLLKTLTANDYELYAGRYWRARSLVMENHLTGSVTRLTFQPFEFGTGLAARDFDPAALPRMR